LIKDLVADEQTVIVASGGAGGQGNANHHPSDPVKGEERTLKLELKLIADVGLVGFPNVGKSTIISNICRVKSRIASFPFTTKRPILGFVDCDNFSFVIADLPGIIEGAHKGKGLGDRFLRHAERTKVLAHVIDMSASEGRDPLADYAQIQKELKSYSGSFSNKEKIVIANKMDLPDAPKHLKRFRKQYDDETIIAISAIQKQNLGELINLLKGLLWQENIPDQ